MAAFQSTYKDYSKLKQKQTPSLVTPLKEMEELHNQAV